MDSKDQQDQQKQPYQPPPELPLWRYMDFHKFVSLLHFQKLHFTRADRFEDVFEGKMGRLFLQDWAADQRQSYERLREYHRQAAPATFVSCWTNLEKESYAMWQIYARENGVAVQTRVARLEKALSNPRVKIRQVQYLDLSGRDRGWDAGLKHARGGILWKNYHICKPKAYEYEREVRALLVADCRDPYLDLQVQVAELVEDIYISPFASRWFVDLVKDLVLSRYGLKDKNIFMSHIQINKSSRS
jgi:hypothetical protein